MALLEINPNLTAEEALMLAGKLAFEGRNRTNIEQTTIKMLIAYASSKSGEAGTVDVESYKNWAAEAKARMGPKGTLALPPAWSAETVARLRDLTTDEIEEVFLQEAERQVEVDPSLTAEECMRAAAKISKGGDEGQNRAVSRALMARAQELGMRREEAMGILAEERPEVLEARVAPEVLDDRSNAQRGFSLVLGLVLLAFTIIGAITVLNMLFG